MARKLNFTMGADPEFTIVSAQTKAQISASELFGDNYCEDGYGGVDISAGNLGYDGHEETGEIRPKPAPTPKGLTKNIGKLLGTLHYLTDGNVQAITQSKFESVGGHIHVSVPENPKGVMEAIQWTLFLASPLLRLTSDATRRGRRGYGEITDVRFNDYDSGRTAEIRFLPAEWLSTPETTEAVLSYIACVYYEALNNPEKVERKFKSIAKKLGFEKDEDEYEDNYRNGYYREEGDFDDSFRMMLDHIQRLESRKSKTFDSLVKKIKREVRSFSCYPQFKSQVSFILSPTRVKKKLEKNGYDAITGWFGEQEVPEKKRHKQPSLEMFLTGSKTSKAPPKYKIKARGELSKLGKDHVMEALGCSQKAVDARWELTGFSDDIMNRIRETGFRPKTNVYLCQTGLDTFISVKRRGYNLYKYDCIHKDAFKVRRYQDSPITNLSYNSQVDTVTIGVPERASLREVLEYYYKVQTNKITYLTMDETKKACEALNNPANAELSLVEIVKASRAVAA